MAALSWLLIQHGERPADWYDEKQWRDMTRAALATLLLSLPGMALLLFARKPLGIFWFPNFVFLVLFLFSGCTLCLTFSRDS